MTRLHETVIPSRISMMNVHHLLLLLAGALAFAPAFQSLRRASPEVSVTSWMNNDHRQALLIMSPRALSRLRPLRDWRRALGLRHLTRVREVMSCRLPRRLRLPQSYAIPSIQMGLRTIQIFRLIQLLLETYQIGSQTFLATIGNP